MAGVQGMSQLVGPDQMKQLKEFLNTYNKITEQCFADCVNDFGSRNVLSKESTCISNCLQKYLKTTSRIGQRFEEHFIEQNEALAAQAGFLKKPGT
ncbi:mitochondrial import inner membrane translocase subunit Tim9-like [Styela clava]|uniref:mitochondrial import inner membrane translocase subunit Tim9-like n=1 Tax=Styela clava TaxID=7725 RepID=UPI00193AC054|nr:mitochondrial import inner membrane translocase subunit Tim9-like [Styela clava]